MAKIKLSKHQQIGEKFSKFDNRHISFFQYICWFNVQINYDSVIESVFNDCREIVFGNVNLDNLIYNDATPFKRVGVELQTILDDLVAAKVIIQNPEPGYREHIYKLGPLAPDFALYCCACLCPKHEWPTNRA